MAKGRPCKICKLKKSNQEAYKQISDQIAKNEKGTTAKFLRELNKKHKLNIILMNVQRHKTHMDGNVTEIKEGDIRKTKLPIELSNTKQSVFNMSFPQLDAKHEKFLLEYRATGYKDKEKAYKKAGYKGAKGAYEMIERREIKAALNEMRAIDFINLKITGNQIIAGLGKVANYTDYIDQMYDEDGNPITNIKLWPEELRCALSAVEMTEDVMKSSFDDEGIVLKRKFKFRFESHLKAKQELRKHFMEVELYRKGEDKEEIYKQIIEKLLLDQINPIVAGLEIDKLGREVPEALKIIMRNDKGKDPETPEHGIKSRIKKRMDKLKNAD